MVGCTSHDHVTDASELVDSWTLVPAAENALSAKTVHFSADLSYSMTLSDGSPSTGTYTVQDPILLVSPMNPAGTVWCSPKVVFSDSDNTLTFSTFEPTACAKAPGGTGSQSPLTGVYKHN